MKYQLCSLYLSQRIIVCFMCMQAILIFFAGQSLVKNKENKSRPKTHHCTKAYMLYKLSHSEVGETPPPQTTLTSSCHRKSDKEHVHLTVTHLFKLVTLC